MTKELPQVVEVGFHGDQIQSAMVEDQVYVPLKRMCENLKIDRPTQQDKVKSDSKFSWRIIPLTAPDGKIYETLCLSDRDCHAWLLGINANKIRADLRDKLLLYQRESMDALAAYWRGETVSRGRGSETIRAGCPGPSGRNENLMRRYRFEAWREIAQDEYFPASSRAWAKVKGLEVLTGENHSSLLPPARRTGGIPWITPPRTPWDRPTAKAKWIMPAQAAEILKISFQLVGRKLKVLHLHGDFDRWCEWSEPYRDQRSKKKYRYDPAVILPAIRKTISREEVG